MPIVVDAVAAHIPKAVFTVNIEAAAKGRKSQAGKSAPLLGEFILWFDADKEPDRNLRC